MKLTVIICAHNPREDHLRRTLDSLRAQTLSKQEWELLLIDNASDSPLAKAWDLSWHPNGRHVAERELGLAAARIRGMKESRSDLLVFVDDDNELDKTYLLQALEIKGKWPALGAWGSGVISPEYELEPADNLKALAQHMLAIRETAKDCWSYVYTTQEAIPWGAGLCVRATVADAYCRANKESSILITGRRGNSLLAGDDNEIAYVTCELGLGIGVFPALRLTHLIPSERVSRKHLLKLVEGAEASDLLLQYKWKGSLPRSPFHLRGMLSILKNSILRRGLDRQAYFAYVRGLITARRIIADAQAKNSVQAP
jgi:glycosyltransferase involved in cell wall biosynthesis